MGPGMSLNLGPRFEQRQMARISLEQKQVLALLLQLKLVAPAPPEAITGIEGINLAHEELLKNNLTGILIGGVAEAVWNKDRTPQELSEHKDVDVLVLPERKGETIEGLDNKIDWWLPMTERLRVERDNSYTEITLSFWQNMNKAILSFGIGDYYNLPKGLLVPNPEWIAEMRFKEAEASTKEELDVEIEEAFLKKIRKRMKNRLMLLIKNTFPNLATIDNVPIRGLDIEEVISLNRYFGTVLTRKDQPEPSGK